MTLQAVLEPLNNLAERVANEAQGQQVPAGTPRFNMAKDAVVRALPTFPMLAAALQASPQIPAMYGPEGADYLALEWVYSTRKTPPRPWNQFSESMFSPTFTYWAIGKLGGVALARPIVRLEDGLSLIQRTPAVLRRIPWWTDGLDGAVLQHDSGMGIVWAVMLHESLEPRRPANMLLNSDGAYQLPMDRLLLALRLVNEADIWHGPIYHGREDRSLGRTSTIPVGPSFRWAKQPEPVNMRRTKVCYAAIRSVQNRLAGDLAHVSTALRRFSQTFDRASSQPEDQLVDDVTALEGSVGREGAELKFSLAFRVSGMLESGSTRRIAMFRDLSSFYNVRSRIVHGSRLTSKEHQIVDREPELRMIVRRLLRGLLASAGTPFDPTQAFLGNKLDEILLSERARKQLVKVMSGPPTPLNEPSGR